MKKTFSIFLSLVIAFGIFAGIPFTENAFDFLKIEAKAASEGDLTFTLNEDGQSYSVTNCNYSASGEIIIPSTFDNLPVTSIGGCAFDYCSSLTSITIPESVTTIGFDAFYGCIKLESISLSDSITSIGENAFYNTAYYNNEDNWVNNALYIVSLLLDVVDDDLGDYVVQDGTTMIASNAFSRCDSLTSVTIPDSVTSISGGAFWGCNYFKEFIVSEDNSVYSSEDGILFSKDKSTLIGYPTGKDDVIFTIPNYVTTIATNAIDQPINLRLLIAGENIKTVEKSAVDILGAVTLPSKTITTFATNGNEAMKVYFDGTAEDFETTFGMSFDEAFNSDVDLYEIVYGLPISTGETDDYYYLVTAENEIEIIGYKHNSQSVTVPSEIEGKSVTSIGAAAFAGIDYLFMDDYCSVENSLSKVTLPETLEHISVYGFAANPYLSEVVLPEGLVSIGAATFYLCDELCVQLPGSLEKISYLSVYGCKYVGLSGNVQKISPAGVLAHYVSIPSTVTGYSESSIYVYYKLYFGGTPSELNSLVENCGIYSESEVLEISYSLPKYINKNDQFSYLVGSDSKVEILGYNRLMTDIEIPETIDGYTVTSIGIAAFSNHFLFADVLSRNMLQTVSLPSTLEKIYHYAFYSCFFLEEIVIPDSVKYIGYEALVLPYANIKIGSGVEFFGWNAVDTLKSVILPSTAKGFIEESVVCSKVYYDGSENELAKLINAGYIYADDYSLYLPVEYKENETYGYYITSDNKVEIVKYLGNDTVVSFPEEIEGKPVVEISSSVFLDFEIGSDVFPDDKIFEVTVVNIPDTVIKLGHNLFDNCKNLTSVNIGNGVKIINDYLFAYCTNLTEITIGNGITNIDEDAFVNCNKLERVKINDLANWCGIKFANEQSNPLKYATELYLNDELVTKLTIPDGVTSISDYAFCGFNYNEEVILPSSITEIGVRAFDYYTYNNRTFYFKGTPDQFSAIKIGSNNREITSARIYYLFNDDNAEGLLSFSLNNDGESYMLRSCVKRVAGDVLIPSTYNDLSVTRIYTSAFSNGGMINTITIPDSVSTIDERAFSGCKELSDIILSEDNETFTVVDNVLFDKINGTLLWYSCNNENEEYVIPDGVKKIGSQSFHSNNYITNVVIPGSVTAIGYDAFALCNSLTSITIPDSVTAIGGFQWSCINLINANCNSYAVEFANENNIETNLIHDFSSDYIVDIEPTCTTDGAKSYHCSRCDEKIDSTVIAGLGHDFSTEWTIDVEPTCTEEGSKSHHCSRCDEKVDVTILDVLGHDFSTEWTIDLEPTCTEDGSKSRHCSRCEEKIDVTSIEAFGHTTSDDWCFSEGYSCLDYDFSYRYKLCSSCGEQCETVYASGHIFENGFCEYCGYSLFSYEIDNNEVTITNYDGKVQCGYDSFEYNYLGNVIIPEYIDGYPVTAIASNAFNVGYICSVSIPKTVTSIGENAFPQYDEWNDYDYETNQCYEITVDEENPVYCSVDGVLFNKAVTELIYYPVGRYDSCYKVPETVTKIHDDALYSYTDCFAIPLSVTYIGGDYLNYDEMGATPPQIAYAGTEDQWNSINVSYYSELVRFETLGLGSIPAIPDMPSIIASIFKYEYVIKNNGTVNITEIYVPYHSYLTSLFPDGLPYVIPEEIEGYPVVAIKDGALQGELWFVNNIEIPDSVTYIGKNEFSETGFYDNDENWENGMLYSGNHLISIDESYTEVTIKPETLTIAKGALGGCCKILTDENTLNYSSADGMLFNKDKTVLYHYPVGSNVKIPTTVTRIDDYVFDSCYDYIVYDGTYNQWLAVDKGENPELDEIIVITADCSIKKIGNQLFYMQGNIVLSSYSGLVEQDGAIYYVVKGVVDESFNGVYSQNSDIYYIENGKVAFDYSGLYYNNGEWLYIAEGVVNNSYTGIAYYQGDYYYVTDGKLDLTYSGVVQHNGNHYYLKNGSLDKSVTTLIDVDGAWHYIEEGTNNWNYTGLVNQFETWFYVENGVLNWNYTGLVNQFDTWFYVENGVINWNYTGLVNQFETWFYVENGALNWNYTGLAEYYGYFYHIANGVLDWNYSGLSCYYGDFYYVTNGCLDWNYTGLTDYYGTWYYVVNGYLDWSVTTLTNYYGTWYYVENGTINWNSDTLCYYGDTWYYVKGGTVAWDYTGYVNYYGTNYYITNGWLDWSRQ